MILQQRLDLLRHNRLKHKFQDLLRHPHLQDLLCHLQLAHTHGFKVVLSNPK
jgi:hypothetical protein